MFKIRPVCGDDMTYPGTGISGGHHVHGFCLGIENQAARIWTIRRIDLDDLTVHDSAHDLGTRNPAFQKTLQCMLMPMNASQRRGFTQNLNIANFRHRPNSLEFSAAPYAAGNLSVL